MVFQPMAIKEISRGGAQVETGFPLQLDSLHDFRLTLGDRSVVVKGRVVHCSISDVDQEAGALPLGHRVHRAVRARLRRDRRLHRRDQGRTAGTLAPSSSADHGPGSVRTFAILQVLEIVARRDPLGVAERRVVEIDPGVRDVAVVERDRRSRRAYRGSSPAPWRCNLRFRRAQSARRRGRACGAPRPGPDRRRPGLPPGRCPNRTAQRGSTRGRRVPGHDRGAHAPVAGSRSSACRRKRPDRSSGSEREVGPKGEPSASPFLRPCGRSLFTGGSGAGRFVDPD